MRYLTRSFSWHAWRLLASTVFSFPQQLKGTQDRHFCIDNPIPLQKELQVELSISATQYTLLFSLFALPNTVLPLFAGYVADKVGRRYGLERWEDGGTRENEQ